MSKAVLEGKILQLLKLTLKNEERFQVNNITLYLKKVEDKKPKHKARKGRK